MEGFCESAAELSSSCSTPVSSWILRFARHDLWAQRHVLHVLDFYASFESQHRLSSSHPGSLPFPSSCKLASPTQFPRLSGL